MTAVPCAGVLTAPRERVAVQVGVVGQDRDVTAVSSAVVAASSTATGPSLTPVTVTVTVAVALPPLPSPIV